MFEQFTESAIKVILLAQEEAFRLGHNWVGSEQILLGLIGEGKGIAACALSNSGVTLKNVRDIVETKIGRGKGEEAFPWFLRWLEKFRALPFTPKARKILEFAVDESKRFGYVGTEHLLLGLIREAESSCENGEKPGVAMQTLQELGIDLIALKKEVTQKIIKS